MSGPFAIYSWYPICLGFVVLVAAAAVAVLWAEAGGKRPADSDDSEDVPPEGDRPPWEQPGAVRRDCEPDRGTTLLWLGRVSVGLVVGAFLLGVVALAAAAPIAVAVLVMASRDRAKMRAGTMDPRGEWLTRKGARYATGTLVLAALVLLGVGCFVYEVIIKDDGFWAAAALRR
jgi:hypothetical protein